MNYEEYGKHHAYDHGGYLLDGIVLETGWTEFDKVYDGKNIPDDIALPYLRSRKK